MIFGSNYYSLRRRIVHLGASLMLLSSLLLFTEQDQSSILFLKSVNAFVIDPNKKISSRYSIHHNNAAVGRRHLLVTTPRRHVTQSSNNNNYGRQLYYSSAGSISSDEKHVETILFVECGTFVFFELLFLKSQDLSF